MSTFQQRVEIGSIQFDSAYIELQGGAAIALKNAIEEAGAVGLSITPRSSDSGRRGYSDTVALWLSRVGPALDHWQAQEKLTSSEALAIRAMTPFEQVPVVLSLEQKGLYFAKDLSKSIIYSVAPPGASQHLSMLAFDVIEFNDPQIRAILAKHRWYPTVVSDLPHFTYLGFTENELPGRGLKKVVFDEREFWLPDIREEPVRPA